MRVLHAEASRQMALNPETQVLAAHTDSEADDRETEWREACTIRSRFLEQIVRQGFGKVPRGIRRAMWK